MRFVFILPKNEWVFILGAATQQHLRVNQFLAEAK